MHLLTHEELIEFARRAVEAIGGPLRASERMAAAGDPISDSAIIQALSDSAGTRRIGTLVRIVSTLEDATVEPLWWIQKRKTVQPLPPADPKKHAPSRTKQPKGRR